ncbi:hypothetical protein C8Q70DRAFT_938104 [Cubamyces menziesii]|nr:hypothetical protein C8Q70DRAFT_938104 [Cubamyces menziesii]
MDDHNSGTDASESLRIEASVAPAKPRAGTPTMQGGQSQQSQRSVAATFSSKATKRAPTQASPSAHNSQSSASPKRSGRKPQRNGGHQRSRSTSWLDEEFAGGNDSETTQASHDSEDRAENRSEDGERTESSDDDLHEKVVDRRLAEEVPEWGSDGNVEGGNSNTSRTTQRGRKSDDDNSEQVRQAPQPSARPQSVTWKKRAASISGDSDVDENHDHKSRHGLPKKKPRQAYSDEEEHARHHEAHSSSRRQVQEIKISRDDRSQRKKSHSNQRKDDEERDSHWPSTKKGKHGSARKASKHHKGDDSTDGHQTDDDSIDLVYKGGTKLGITEQRPRVRKTLNAAIHMCQADLLIRNAFPDGAVKYNDIARNALVKSAGDLGYKDIVKRLKRDDTYALSLASIPVDRIPLFRSRVREAVAGAITSTYGLRPGDIAHVNWLQKRCRYIYPDHNFERDKCTGEQPYELAIFADSIRAAYFKSPKSFGWRIMTRFTSSFPEKPEEKEIPAVLLALASTAIFAAIDDHRSEKCEASDFTTNKWSGAYQRNLNILSSLKEQSLEAYHDLLHGLYRTICGSATTAGHTGESDDDVRFLKVKRK